MGFVKTTDGTEIFYKDWGPKDAQPIVFHHGWPLSSDDWDAQMLFFLSKGFLVVAHDLNPLLGVLGSAIYLLDGHAHYAAIDEVVDADLLTHLYGTKVQVASTLEGKMYMRSGS